jgi:threonine aldolase
MYNFKNDYSEGCHPRILEALTRTNLDATVGYGLDEHCAAAAERIRTVISCPGADVHFLVGGTQTNATAISAFLRPHQGAVTVSTGHINTHETGAVEATGHKILVRDASDGKVTPAIIDDIVSVQTDEHVIQPKLVYLSQSTELGTVYSLAELEAIRACCDRHGLYLYLDGARLACGLGASDVTLTDLPQLCDAFYIGGTKNGALFGEALVIVNEALKPDFRYYIKRHGGMLAKGRLLGIQFEELFRDELYLELGRHSNRMAQILQAGLLSQGVELFVSSPTNQIFPIVPNGMLKPLEGLCRYEVWGAVDSERTAIRFVTSWASKEEEITEFLQAFHQLMQEF